MRPLVVSLLVLTWGCGSRSSILLWRGDGSPPDGPRPEASRPGPGWASIPAGAFMMGSPPGEPCREAGGTAETQHQVTITLPFRLGTTEVTQEQFRERRGYNPSRFASCGASCPVEQVSWHEAAAYCNALSTAEKRSPCYTCTGTAQEVRCSESPAYAGRIQTCPGYRLPTEAEWEYAYRAGTSTAFYNGPIGTRCDEDPRASEIGWYQSNSGGKTHPVGRKKANAWGLLDLPGNVWEWCHDGYLVDLGSAPATDPQGSAQSPSRVLRGSSWLDGAGHLRAADRFGYPPAGRNSNIGFRCARQE